MASKDGSTSFEAIIHADRERKKNEDLANQIFGRTKSSQNVKKSQKDPRSPSLASRMGVQKRTSSSSAPPQKNPFNPPSRPSSTTPSHSNRSHRDSQSNARSSRIANEIDIGNANITSSRNNSFTSTATSNKPTSSARNGTSTPQPQQGPGLTIKGSAGPFTIHASNFAQGTTEADITAALQPELFDDAGNSCLQTCRLVATRPAVIAEMVLSERTVAERIVRKFDGMKADGRILRVEIVKSGSTSASGPSRGRERNTRRDDDEVTQSVEAAPVAEDMTVAGPPAAEGDMEMDDVEANAEYPATTPYDHEREAADRERRVRERDRDGYGSSRRDDRDRPRDDRDRRRDDRDRIRDRDHDRHPEDERDRRRDDDRRERERDRDYDRRESQSQSQPQSYSSRGPPQPPYGNGFNRPPRGGGGYGYGGPRGGYGFPRGRGGYGMGGSGGYRGYGR